MRKRQLSDLPPKKRQRVRNRINQVAWLLDSSIRLPGGFRIGVDALIGLVPFLGDAVGVLFSGYILRQAVKVGAPTSLLLRMVFNIAIEGVIGAVPLLGDIFDAAWKANMRNAALLNHHLDRPEAAAKSSRFFVAVVILSFVAFLALMLGVSVLTLRWLRSALG